LTTGGYTVRFAADGDEALTEITRHRPDLVVLDLMMPRVDGMRVLDELRASPVTHNLPVIVVTAKDLGPAEMIELQDQTAAVMHKAALRAEDVLTEVRTALARAGFTGALAVH
jgi:CheY-like chemotaxis protein